VVGVSAENSAHVPVGIGVYVAVGRIGEFVTVGVSGIPGWGVLVGVFVDVGNCLVDVEEALNVEVLAGVFVRLGVFVRKGVLVRAGVLVRLGVLVLPEVFTWKGVAVWAGVFVG
jgi:hypothetical protein